jgi:hypothetical protein
MNFYGLYCIPSELRPEDTTNGLCTSYGDYGVYGQQENEE